MLWLCLSVDTVPELALSACGFELVRQLANAGVYQDAGCTATVI